MLGVLAVLSQTVFGQHDLISIKKDALISGNGASLNPVVSTNGQYAAFASGATNLVTGDTNGLRDVFWRDRVAGVTRLVSRTSAGTSGNGDSDSPVLSQDGRYVAFHSRASNLVTNSDSNADYDVFLWDSQDNSVVLVSRAADGASGAGMSFAPQISANGRVVSFASLATNLVSNDTNGTIDAFARDLELETSYLASINTNGFSGNGSCGLPVLSADGRYVAFLSAASDLVTNDFNSVNDAFVRDLQTGVTKLVSVNTAGTDGGSGASYGPAISSNGRYVAFSSLATNLVAVADTNGLLDVFVRDLQTSITKLLSVNRFGTAAGSSPSGLPGSSFPLLSADGTRVLFVSHAADLVEGDTNNKQDVFLRDHVNSTTTLISVNAAGTGPGNHDSGFGEHSMSASLELVTFFSEASDLVVGTVDTNGKTDVFLRNLSTGTTELISRAGTGGASGNGLSHQPRLSANGATLLFTSEAENLVAGDTNGVSDVFAFESAALIMPEHIVPRSALYNPYLESALTGADRRYIRGPTNMLPLHQSFVIPLDFQRGVKLPDLGNFPDMFTTNLPWSTNDSLPWVAAVEPQPLREHMSDGARVTNNNPIVAFGTSVGGTPLYSGGTYKFGLYFGGQYHPGDISTIGTSPFWWKMTNTIRILVYQRSAFTPGASNVVAIATNYIRVPSLPVKPGGPDYSAYLAEYQGFVSNNCVVTHAAHDLQTVVQLVDGQDSNSNSAWGVKFWNEGNPNAISQYPFHPAFVVAHKASSTNYCYLVEGMGVQFIWLNNATNADGSKKAHINPMNLAGGTTTTPDWDGLYSLDFGNRPSGLPQMVSQVQFESRPLPPAYVGKSLEALTNPPPALTDFYDLSDTVFTNLNNSPELRRHPILDSFVSDLRNDPLALAQFVINEVELADPLALADSAQESPVINAGGVSRSALGAFLERQGSPLEQCALLIYFLRQAGVPAAYMFGPTGSIQMSDVELSHLLQMRIKGAVDYRGIAYTAESLISVNYPWVVANIGERTVHIFPWLKDTQIIEGLNLYDYMPTNYSTGYQVVKDYVKGNTNILGLSDVSDSLADLFPKFIEKKLLENHPGISLDDIGTKVVHRKHSLARWEDLRRPLIVTGSGEWQVVTNFSTGGAVVPRLTNVFNLVRFQVTPDSNPTNILMDSGELRAVDLHNRRMLIWTNGTNLQFSLAAYHTNLTSVSNFTGDADLLNAQVMQASAGGSTNLQVKVIHRRNIGLTNTTPYLGLIEVQTKTNLVSYRFGDVSGLCLNFGRVSRPMLQAHLDQAVRHQAQQTNSSWAPSEDGEGTLAYLLGMSYYESVSRFREMNERFHKIRVLSKGAAGLASLRFSAGGGTNLMQPSVDMNFGDLAVAGSASLRLDAGDDYYHVLQDYWWVNIAALSAEEHMAIQRFFDAKSAVSTIRLLHLANQAAPVGEYGFLEVDSRNYSSITGTPGYDSNIWASVQTAVTTGWGFEQGRAFITKTNVNVPDTYSGMAALIWTPDTATALINNQLNGAKAAWLLWLKDNGPGTYYLTQDGVVVKAENGKPKPDGAYARIIVTKAFQLLTLSMEKTAVICPLGAMGDLTPEQMRSVLFAHASFGIQDTRPSAAVSKFLTMAQDPVDVISGAFYLDGVDLTLPGLMPLQVRRNYSSQNLARTQLGWGWKVNYAPNLGWTSNASGDARLTAYEPDGGVVSFRPSVSDTNLFVVMVEDNPALSHNNNEGGASGQRVLSTIIERTNVSGAVFYYLRPADGSLRVFEERSYPLTSGTNTMSRTRPYLVRWQDSLGNAHTFEYGTNSVLNDYGEVRRIQSSNGNYLLMRYDETGRVVEVRAGDGRTVNYEFDVFGDLVGVTLPDSSQINYEYSHYTGSYTNTNNVVGTYLDSDHRLVLETKPDGRQLKNEYDNQHRVVKQWATAGADLNLVQNATFTYVSYNTNASFSLTNAATNLLWGTTYVVDAYGKTNRHDYTNNLITRVVDALGNEILQDWYWSTNEAGGYPRALKSRRDERGLTNTFYYDASGNMLTNVVSGTDLTGTGVTNAVATTTYTNTFLVATVTDPLTNRVRYVYGDTNYPRLPTMVIREVGSTAVSTNLMVYTSATSVVTNGNQMFTNTAYGLVATNVSAYASPDAATNSFVSDGRGFLLERTRYTRTPDSNVVVNLLHNDRGELVEQWDAAGRTNRFAYDEMGRPRWTEVIDETGALRSWALTYYNGNGEPTWSDGPRYNPEDYVWRDYDGMGRKVQEIRWRSRAKADGSGVEAEEGDALFSTAFAEYDVLGSLLVERDQYGNTNQMTYDANGQVIVRSRYSAFNSKTVALDYFGYEPGGQVAVHTNAYGAVTRKFYTTTGKLMRQENADGTTNRLTYDLTGRVKREYLPDGASYWETTYDDLNRKVTRTFSADTNYTETKVFDRRGNLVLQTNLVGAVFTNFYDGLDRLKESQGPATVNGVSTQQVTTVYYDAAGVWTTNANSLGEKTVTQKDALGRTVRMLVLDADDNTVRDSSTAYSADHHAVTVTLGNSAAVATTTYTDTFGKPVLTRLADDSFTVNTYDMVGNPVSSRDELGQVTYFECDALGRILLKTLPDGAQVAYSYDLLGNLLVRAMPGGIRWSGTYDTLGRKTAEQLSGGLLKNRNYAYTYHAGSHTNSGGLLQSVIDPRGLTNTTSYDVLRRATTLVAAGTQAEYNQTTTFGYDRLSRATNVTQSTTGLPTSIVQRWFDGYGQLTREQVTLGGTLVSDFSQTWNAAGRRKQLAQAGAGTNGTINYAHWADGLLQSVAQGSVLALFNYDDAGRLNSRTNNWRGWAATRDSRGRVTGTSMGVGTNTVMTETLGWRENSTLNSYAVTRTGAWDENRDFLYDTRNHLTQETFQPAADVTATNDYAFDPGKLGVLVSLTSTGAVNAAWTAGGLDLLGRVGTENWTGPSNLLVRLAGRAAGAASNSVWLNGTLLTTNLVTNAYGGWLADMALSPSNYTLSAEGAYPASVLGTRRATNTFTVEDRVGGVTNRYDAAGNVTNRVVPGQAQSLVWDAAGRLVRVASTSGGSTNWLWTAAYDALGRRLQTVHSPTGAVATTITSYYDPQVEFGEIGVSVNGVRTWKVLGPDLNGTYGGLQGIGGLEGEVREDGNGLGAVGDWFGNVAASVVGTQVVWSGTRVSGYGPVAGYAAPVLGGESYVSQVSLWRSRRVDPTGLYWLGARYYDPIAGRFISCDPFGHEASWDLYSYANGDPVNYLDPDGRLGKNLLKTVGAIVESPFRAFGNIGRTMAGDTPLNLLNPMSRNFIAYDLASGALTPGRLAGGFPFGIFGGDNFDHQETEIPGSRTTSINGVFNTISEGQEMRNAVNAKMEVNDTVDVANGTHPGSLKFGDLIQVLGEELGLITISSIRAADAINQAGGGNVIAHSQGTSVFRGALALLPNDIRANIDYQGAGGQSFINAGLYGLNSARNVANPGDPVPWMSPLNYFRSIGTSGFEMLPAKNNGTIGFGFHTFMENYKNAIHRP